MIGISCITEVLVFLIVILLYRKNFFKAYKVSYSDLKDTVLAADIYPYDSETKQNKLFLKMIK